MFSQLRIRGVGVIDDATLDLSPGLNVLTGETGAGKTMVVSGLGLLLGDRADAGLVRSGLDAALIEGVLSLPVGHPALARAAEAGGEHDDGELIIARTVTAAGRSRAHVGGRSAPVGVLGELGRLLVAVHGQSDQWRLKAADAHREVLDDFAGPAVHALRDTVGARHDEWSRLRAEQQSLTRDSRERARQLDGLLAALEEIEQVDPQPGEDLALRQEDERLAHVDALRTAAAGALGDLTGLEESAYAADPAPSARDLLGSAGTRLSGAADHDQALAALAGRVRELVTLVTDVGADVSGYLADLDLDPARLEQVQQRRAALSVLTRKYGETIDEVLAWSQRAAAQVETLQNAEERAGSLDAELARAEADLITASAALTAARRKAAKAFSTRVGKELAHLALGKAAIEVSITPLTRAGGPRGDADQGDQVEQVERTEPLGASTDGPSAEAGAASAQKRGPAASGGGVNDSSVRIARHGADDIEILFAANPGAKPRNVAKAASGGELSRLMLALEVVGTGADGSGPPTFVFDEVDAGVGGRAALDIGARLKALSEHAQVIVVTHLAQVAAFADRHLVVHKSDDGSITSSGVSVVEGDARRQELARMMSGDSESAAGLAHAEDLLAQAGELGAAGLRAG